MRLDGTMNGECFRAYVQQVPVPTLQPGDTIIPDNPAAQKIIGIRQSIAGGGAVLIYLKPYRPQPKDRRGDFDPIDPSTGSG